MLLKGFALFTVNREVTVNVINELFVSLSLSDLNIDPFDSSEADRVF